jgi:hypothetical protein
MSSTAGLASTRQSWSPAWCPALLGCPLRVSATTGLSSKRVRHYWAVLDATNLEPSLLSATTGLSSTRQTWSPAWCPPLPGCPLRDKLGVQPNVRHCWAVLYAANLESSLMSVSAGLSSTRQSWSPAYCPPLLGCPLRNKLGVQPNVRHCRVVLYATNLESSLMSATAGLSSTQQIWSPAWCPPLPGCPLCDNLGVQPDVRPYWAVLYATILESSLMSATAGLSSTQQTWSPAWCPPLPGCPLCDNLGVQPDVRPYWVVQYATILESSLMSATAGLSSTR